MHFIKFGNLDDFYLKSDSSNAILTIKPLIPNVYTIRAVQELAIENQNLKNKVNSFTSDLDKLNNTVVNLNKQTADLKAEINNTKENSVKINDLQKQIEELKQLINTQANKFK